MVSLAVVVAAILAVLVLVFSDQPATDRMRGRRGRASSVHRPMPPSQPASTLVLRGPPAAHVLQQQLALPSTRPRVPRPAAAGAPADAPAATKPLPRTTTPDRADDVRIGKEEGLSFFTRARSSVALLVLLAAVGTTVALAIGSVLYLAGLALRHTLG
jgi:hypothetical protein